LEPWQHFIFGNIYGWKRVVNGERTNLWRFNINYIEVPRKNGKTTICAAGASYDCAFLEETGAEVYILATKEDQAKLMYNDVAAYVAKSPALAEVFEILKGKNTIYSVESARTSFIKPLGADSERLDGLNPIAAYADELHAWPSRALWDVMEDSFGSREQWHMVAITTAGTNRQGICYEQRDHLINILEGRVVDDHKFGVIFTLDEEDRDAWDEERTWFKANPNLGCGKQLDYMRQKAEQAKQMPSSLNTFLNKQLDIWTDVAEAWLSVDQWNACASNYGLELLKHKRCTAAFDLARVGDLSAVGFVYPKQAGLTVTHLWTHFYLPEALLRARSGCGVAYPDARQHHGL
jgi:phage terminase large subunit-like protein